MTISINNVALTGNVATLTTAAPHGIPAVVNGFPAVVAVVGLTNTFLNSVWTLLGVTSTTLSFSVTHANVTSQADSGSIIAYSGQELRVSQLGDAIDFPAAARLLLDDPAKAGAQGMSLAVLQSVLLGNVTSLVLTNAGHTTTLATTSTGTRAVAFPDASGTVVLAAGALPIHSLLIGTGTPVLAAITPTVAGRLLVTTGSATDPAFSVSVSNTRSGIQSASTLSTMMSGTNPQATQGNLRTSEIVVVNKGEGGNTLPNWNAAGQNLNAFGHGIMLQNKMLFTAWGRNTQETIADGNGQLLISRSVNYGASWSVAQSIYTASADASFNALANVTCWQANSGRIFVDFAKSNVGTGEVKNMLLWTDDPTGVTGWTTPIEAMDPGLTFAYYAVVQGMELSDGTTQVLMGYGKNIGQPNDQRTATMLQSTNGGTTWTRRSVMNLYSDTTLELIEACAAYRADGVLLASFRNNLNSRIYFKTSSDSGLTWSSLGAQYLQGGGKPPMVTLTNGTIALMTRSVTLPTFESCLFVCRDGSGMLANSWGTEHDFDPRHYYYAYGALYEVSPNVIGCNFTAESTVIANQSDWSYIMFADGGTMFPTGTIHVRDIFGCGLAVNRQSVITIPSPIVHVGNAATGTQLAAAINALIDQCRDNGTGFQHPADVAGCLGWWEPWRAASNINDWTDVFTHADSTTVVADATRTSGQTLTPTQPKGTWGTDTNKLYLSATTGGSGYQPIIAWDFGKGDGIATLLCPSWSTTPMILALRVVDASNMLMAYVDGTNLRLYKVAAATATDLAGAVPIAISSTNSVGIKVVAAGSLISIYVNVNGAGFPAGPQLIYTLTGGDATTYANTVTKWGVMQFATGTNRFTSFVFNGTLAVGDKLGQLVDLSGASASVGDLLQILPAKQMTWQNMPSMFGGKQFLFSSSAALGYSTGAFASKDAPFTIFWAGVIPQSTGGSRSLCLIWDGVGTHSAQIGVDNSNHIYAGSQAGAFNAPAFSGYPQGPLILRIEVNGASSKLFINGQLAITFNAAAVTGETLIQFGDTSNQSNTWWLHGSAFNSILTPQQAREHERLIAATLQLEGWNPR